ncbi:hypothetical protein COW36_17015 [bacterium (Candidatus Blackallbacteria) CG17_big_fil_post_rev_8_21_14_2_50_48_46]|uniref:PrcB C-terminal domain-containing protein n=1 Tax=bacterium (Candidatus Blackallbacteria) CG17_big_fil_post_rev_8_21_14_2_50_48_46 TaxID=2014261 RepID=A0A2M7G1C9_9BACT|nr:MAG: hypothetical protein COW64_09325 [bacterium (Candidatus Blackallbacteria) CG18_big_fil_WC_8_21_14_2_50_49_26]PIW15503.1 MAG: hypothetical protein COW36_17015 [bacterium (Candidatus Blackallbacteria) CG17_big_fil_post_rev_8_21_14_2_50_48_46]PIW48597.1 MAG: hypothetical protein COW20_08830 [bacterium (Candidatus Blackallbacteria) CG13_big_fil_rev_8_21_14_2_50_49_14]
MFSSRFVFLSLLSSLVFMLEPGCGIRKPTTTPLPSASPSISPSSTPSSSPSPGSTMIQAKILPSIETNDAVVAEAQKLQAQGLLTDLIILESYPVQISAKGTPEAIQKLQNLAKGTTGSSALTLETLSTRSSRILSSENLAVSDEASWQELWLRHYGSNSDRPMVNFETETVLAVFAGQKRTGGYSIRITQVAIKGSELVVSYQETAPSSSNLVSQSLSSPAHLVKVRSSKLAGDFSSVRFEKTL